MINELIASTRTETGKGAARSLRRRKMVPAIFYGPKSKPMNLTVAANELEKLLRSLGQEASNRLIRLTIDDGNGQDDVRQVMLKEVQVHPVRRRFLHVDFYEVAMDRMVDVEVPIQLTGKAEGTQKGGIVNQVRRVLSIRCLPGEIPDKIMVDISHLDIGDAIHVEDLVSKVGFELLEEGRFTVVTINAPEGAEESQETETEEGEEVKS